MRNYYNSCCDGEAVIGRIIYGNKYPFGTVSEETYTTDMERLNGTIADLNDSLYDVNRRTSGLEQIVIAGDLAHRVSDNASAISDINTELDGVQTTLSNKANRSEVPLIQVLDAEPADRNCIWFKPCDPSSLQIQGTEVIIRDSEPDINNCIWFKPYGVDPVAIEAYLDLNSDPSGSEILSNIGGVEFGVNNATTSENIPEGVYNFTIF